MIGILTSETSNVDDFESDRIYDCWTMFLYDVWNLPNSELLHEEENKKTTTYKPI